MILADPDSNANDVDKRSQLNYLFAVDNLPERDLVQLFPC